MEDDHWGSVFDTGSCCFFDGPPKKQSAVACVILFWFTLGSTFHRWRLRRLAIHLFHALNAANVDYWVDFGTLLGIYREGDLIRGDNDVDVCVTNVTEKQMHTVQKLMNERGHRFTPYVWHTITRAYDMPWGGAHADLYHVKLSEDGQEFFGATGASSNIPFHLIGDRKRQWWVRGGVFVNVPSDVPGTLTWRYGDDYMTPRHNFKGRDSKA